MDYLKQNHLSILIIVFLIASSLLGGKVPTLGAAANVTTIGNPWVFANTVAISAAETLTSTFKLGTNGTALSEVKSGTCTIWSNATTIAASTTQTVECTGATNGSLSGISGIQSGDRVFVSLASTTVAGYEGLSAQWVSASTTANGGIMIKIFNGTGTTFTWASTASSSIPYVVFR